MAESYSPESAELQRSLNDNYEKYRSIFENSALNFISLLRQQTLSQEEFFASRKENVKKLVKAFKEFYDEMKNTHALDTVAGKFYLELQKIFCANEVDIEQTFNQYFLLFKVRLYFECSLDFIHDNAVKCAHNFLSEACARVEGAFVKHGEEKLVLPGGDVVSVPVPAMFVEDSMLKQKEGIIFKRLKIQDKHGQSIADPTEFVTEDDMLKKWEDDYGVKLQLLQDELTDDETDIRVLRKTLENERKSKAFSELRRDQFFAQKLWREFHEIVPMFVRELPLYSEKYWELYTELDRVSIKRPTLFRSSPQEDFDFPLYANRFVFQEQDKRRHEESKLSRDLIDSRDPLRELPANQNQIADSSFQKRI